jgi:hypothetical protein
VGVVGVGGYVAVALTVTVNRLTRPVTLALDMLCWYWCWYCYWKLYLLLTSYLQRLKHTVLYKLHWY